MFLDYIAETNLDKITDESIPDYLYFHKTEKRYFSSFNEIDFYYNGRSNEKLPSSKLNNIDLR